MAEVTNLSRKAGTLADMLVGADVFIGVSRAEHRHDRDGQDDEQGRDHLRLREPDAGDLPRRRRRRAARGSSPPAAATIPNQINNVLAFPGIFRGAFDVRASDINEEMKIAAAEALAGLVAGDELSEDYIIPAAFDPRVGPAVAKAVAEAARRSGVARL